MTSKRCDYKLIEFCFQDNSKRLPTEPICPNAREYLLKLGSRLRSGTALKNMQDTHLLWILMCVHIYTYRHISYLSYITRKLRWDQNVHTGSELSFFSPRHVISPPLITRFICFSHLAPASALLDHVTCWATWSMEGKSAIFSWGYTVTYQTTWKFPRKTGCSSWFWMCGGWWGWGVLSERGSQRPVW